MAVIIFNREKIRLEEADGLIYCFFPKELKNDFRASFPSAKWDPVCRCWIVTKRVRKRALSWAENAIEAAKKCAELEELELQEEELRRLKGLVEDLANRVLERRREVEDLRHEILEIQNAKVKEQKLLEMLRAEEEKLESLRQQRDEEQHRLEEQRRKIDEFLSKIIDLPKLKGVVLATFAKYHRLAGSTAHEMFDRAQAEFREARDKLRENGYRLAALDYLCSANFNRPDRDSVKFMPKDAWYDLRKIEDE